jgi:hypothetical protein
VRRLERSRDRLNADGGCIDRASYTVIMTSLSYNPATFWLLFGFLSANSVDRRKPPRGRTTALVAALIAANDGL